MIKNENTKDSIIKVKDVIQIEINRLNLAKIGYKIAH